MRFFKYEGLGNDFILFQNAPNLSPENIRKLCDRHFGIGADGILFLSGPNPNWRMDVYNSDGSQAKMCGNGIRCAAQWLLDQGQLITHIETQSGIKSCTYESGLWSIDMGIAQIDKNRVSMGNPHLVLPGPVDQNQIDPQVNTEFFELIGPTEISVTVFERGVGETLACGTGACACVALLASRNALELKKEITVHLKGGNLYISAHPTETGLQIQMKGPARYVFEGEVFEE